MSASRLPPCSLYALPVQGETGGDGRILIVSGVLRIVRLLIGGRVFSGLYEGKRLFVESGEACGLKFSRGLPSGGDIRLDMGGNCVMLMELW